MAWTALPFSTVRKSGSTSSAVDVWAHEARESRRRRADRGMADVVSERGGPSNEKETARLPRGGRAVESLLPMGALRAAQRVAAVEALVADAVADRRVAAEVAEGGVAHHLAQVLRERAALGVAGHVDDVDVDGAAGRGLHRGRLVVRRRGRRGRRGRLRGVGLPDEVRHPAEAGLAVGGLDLGE